MCLKVDWMCLTVHLMNLKKKMNFFEGALPFWPLEVRSLQKWAPHPGWDKIFHFVGANTFNQKFCTKQRELDSTEDIQNSGNLGISSCDKKFLSVTRNFFLWQEIFATGRKFLPVTKNLFLWIEISKCSMKFLSVTRSFFLWQEVSFCDKKFLSVTKSFFLW